jgi:NAD(P)-dependent dehydrogenase (short-subunit alcohol dehydrogenase family)
VTRASGEKIAVVTGAGSGIGRATTLALVRGGFTIVLAGRRKDALDETAALAAKDNGKTLVVPTDVRDPASVRSLFQAAKDEYGRVDLLFNNAGISARSAPIDEIPYEQWMDVVQVNVTGYFLCTQEAFRVMRDQNPQGGRIINNGSIAAHSPRPGTSPYTITKHSVTGLTKATSLDGRPFGIACGQIDIGNALTNRTEGYTKGTTQANGTVAIEPTMDVEKAAESVAYMASMPLDTNVLFMTVMATAMPFVGRG